MSDVLTIQEQYPSLYESGIVDLGPMNASALKRLAFMANQIVVNKEPYPPSPFVKFVADLLTNEDKQDFSIILSGEKGSGKSYSALYLAPRIADEVAKVLGGTRDDYFSLDNCALLEDSDGVNKILKNSKKYQILISDDAGVSISNRDFATTSNKNFNKLLSTCRTMRWCLILTVPMRSHLDKQVRELVSASATVYKSFHKGGFNIIKMGKVKILQSFKDKAIYPRFSFNERKIDFWVAFSPDPELAKAYDIKRDMASQRLIAEALTGEEVERLLPREKKWLRIVEEHYETVKNLKGKRSIKSIMRETGLTESNVNKLISMVMKEERDNGDR
jgi:hypothetical protein